MICCFSCLISKFFIIRDCLTKVIEENPVRTVKEELNQRLSMADPRKYRDRIYIVKDIILTLSEYGQLNQTALFSFCGLNISKHKDILDSLQENEMIQSEELLEGKRKITIFKATQKGMEFCNQIIAPYEKLFPRKEKSSDASVKFKCLVVI